MASHARRLASRVDALSLRERILIFVSVLVAVVLAWFQFAMQPVITAERHALRDINSARERIEAADAAIRAQSGALDLAPGSSFDTQLAHAHRRAAQVEALIDARAAEIVDPATMAEVLEDLLVGQKGLRLIRAHNLAAERLLESDDEAPLYRHTLRLELEGPYLAVLEYLRRIESLPWRIYWQGIEIDAEEFPRNRVRIDVSTLSFEEDWIGV